MKRFEFSLLIALLFCAAVSFLSFEEECNDIRHSVLRLHILADSDSEEDQALKLLVRDRIIEESVGIFSDCDSYDEAKAAAECNLDKFEAAARETLEKNGCFDSVSVSLNTDYFSTRVYDNITLPAGTYEALQIKIGAAGGHNWWCVMFPSICLPGASCDDELDEILTDSQVSIVSGSGYELRFRCVELYEEFMEKLRHSENDML